MAKLVFTRSNKDLSVQKKNYLQFCLCKSVQKSNLCRKNYYFFPAGFITRECCVKTEKRLARLAYYVLLM